MTLNHLSSPTPAEDDDWLTGAASYVNTSRRRQTNLVDGRDRDAVTRQPLWPADNGAYGRGTRRT